VLNFFGGHTRDDDDIKLRQKWNDWDVMDDDDVKDDPADFENQPELDDRDEVVIHDQVDDKEISDEDNDD